MVLESYLYFASRACCQAAGRIIYFGSAKLARSHPIDPLGNHDFGVLAIADLAAKNAQHANFGGSESARVRRAESAFGWLFVALPEASVVCRAFGPRTRKTRRVLR